MPNVKHIPAIGLVPVAFSMPTRICGARHPNEQTTCNLAPHVRATQHAGYFLATDSTINWPSA